MHLAILLGDHELLRLTAVGAHRHAGRSQLHNALHLGGGLELEHGTAAGIARDRDAIRRLLEEAAATQRAGDELRRQRELVVWCVGCPRVDAVQAELPTARGGETELRGDGVVAPRDHV